MIALGLTPIGLFTTLAPAVEVPLINYSAEAHLISTTQSFVDATRQQLAATSANAILQIDGQTSRQAAAQSDIKNSPSIYSDLLKQTATSLTLSANIGSITGQQSQTSSVAFLQSAATSFIQTQKATGATASIQQQARFTVSGTAEELIQHFGVAMLQSIAQLATTTQLNKQTDVAIKSKAHSATTNANQRSSSTNIIADLSILTSALKLTDSYVTTLATFKIDTQTGTEAQALITFTASIQGEIVIERLAGNITQQRIKGVIA